MTKTMSIRMDQENYEFLTSMIRDEQRDLSKAVRELVTRGRVLLALERYRNSEVSLGKAAEIAGITVGEMMDLLTRFGIRSRIDMEDYREGLANLASVW